MKLWVHFHLSLLAEAMAPTSWIICCRAWSSTQITWRSWWKRGHRHITRRNAKLKHYSIRSCLSECFYPFHAFHSALSMAILQVRSLMGLKHYFLYSLTFCGMQLGGGAAEKRRDSAGWSLWFCNYLLQRYSGLHSSVCREHAYAGEYIQIHVIHPSWLSYSINMKSNIFAGGDFAEWLVYVLWCHHWQLWRLQGNQLQIHSVGQEFSTCGPWPPGGTWRHCKWSLIMHSVV